MIIYGVRLYDKSKGSSCKRLFSKKMVDNNRFCWWFDTFYKIIEFDLRCKMEWEQSCGYYFMSGYITYLKIGTIVRGKEI